MLLYNLNPKFYKHMKFIFKAFMNSCKISHTSIVPVPCDSILPCGEENIGLIVAGYKTGDNMILSETAKLLDIRFRGRLTYLLSKSLPYPSIGEARVFHGVDPLFTPIVVVGAGVHGEHGMGYSIPEQVDEKKEAVRIAAATGVRVLSEFTLNTIYIESFGHAESAAEGSTLATWIYQDLISVNKKKRTPKLVLFNSCDFTGWQIGIQKAAAQNLARYLQEKPGNDLTPQIFAQSVVDLLSKYSINVEVQVEQWAKRRNLHGFLAVAKGSCEPPIFLEVFYEGCDPHVCPIVLVGKGVTFNSGGLCLRKCKDMKDGRGDLSGAACVVAAMRAIAILQLPINVRGLIPLCTNTPGSLAYKPGDIIRVYNGKTIQVGSTQTEGLLLHADALSYSQEYRPKVLLDIGNITSDIVGALGEAACGCFSNNESLFEMMRIATIHSGDRIWRLPLWNYFSDYVKNTPVSDLKCHLPRMIGGGSCKGAAFLREFVPSNVDWIHLDTSNIYTTEGKDFMYLREGMSGRPTRSIIEFLAQFACQHP